MPLRGRSDSTFGVAAAPASLHEYARRLGVTPREPAATACSILRDSGFARLASDRVVLILDVGSVGPTYLPAHAHASTLAFDGRRLVCDAGVSTYETCAQRPEERGTAVHNTIMLDGEDSSEVCASFRVGRRARVRGATVECKEGQASSTATHDGYRHLAGRPLHCRRWNLAADELSIVDRIGRTGGARSGGLEPDGGLRVRGLRPPGRAGRADQAQRQGVSSNRVAAGRAAVQEPASSNDMPTWL